MQNREVSWLNFDERVLDEAASDKVPLLERLKFVSIFDTNLDEFFMIRMGSLHDMCSVKNPKIDTKTGMTPQQQIEAILSMLPRLYQKYDRIYQRVIDELRIHGIYLLTCSELTKSQRTEVKDFYKQHIEPLVSPQIVDFCHPFPFLENKQIYVYAELEKKGNKYFGFIPIRSSFPRYKLLSGPDFNCILTEQIILEHTEIIFKGFKVQHKTLICVTRNFDISDNNELRDEFADYMDYMKRLLKKRTRLSVVRLESSSTLSENMGHFLLSKLNLQPQQHFVTTAPLNMKFIFSLIGDMPTALRENLLYHDFAQYNPLDYTQSITASIRNQDILLSYPYDSIDAFVGLLREAASDPECVSIKIAIYRLSNPSHIVKYLCIAAENGKEVTIFMELKARFDEENNIHYAKILFESGCHIVYGFGEYKVHSKLCLITYRQVPQGITYITQVGTGNYNEKTSYLYADLSLLTANQEIGLDANDFFKNMAMEEINGHYKHLLQSPTSLCQGICACIDREIAKGPDGFIFCKFNSLTHRLLINKLALASQQGVTVKLMVRGICCLLPGVPGVTENIQVHSIVGRFLEHARIYVFGKEPDCHIYISSADFMTRNMEHRIEIAAPIYDPVLKQRLLDYLDIQFADNIKGRIVNITGRYRPIKEGSPCSSQDYFINLAKQRKQQTKQEPVAPPPATSFWSKLARIFKA